MKKNTKLILSAIVITLIVVIVLIVIFPNKEENGEHNNYKVEIYKGEKYYIIEDDYSGDYDIKYLNLNEYADSDTKQTLKEFNKEEVMTYKEYAEYCKKWDVKQAYNDESKNYIIIAYAANGQPNLKARLADVKYNKSTATVYIWDDASGVTADIAAYVLAIPTSTGTSNVDIVSLYTSKEFKNIKEYGYPEDPRYAVEDKPIIYLYPTKEQTINVKLLNKENITVSYPKYQDGWTVTAKPNGDLIDKDTNKKLYALYYESKAAYDFKIEEDGFVVKGTDTIKFLEEKLKVLGLNDREMEEFIVYWLPVLEKNNYNYIRFATKEEINKSMPLEVTPKPETEIRILMTYKPLKDPITLKEQQLNKVTRKGYTMVEWGGLEIKESSY